jgi:hypothetical protein
MRGFIGRLLCAFGLHDEERVPSITGRPIPWMNSLMDGWRCRRCPWSWGPLEWPRPGKKART